MTTTDATTSTRSTGSTTPAPIVLIHGLWMTPRSWDTWAARYRALGHDVIVPGWPGIDERSPAEIRENPAALAGIGLEQIADHYERIIRSLPERPIIMGHSFGGVILQMLADRDLGIAYVGVQPGQIAGVRTLPLSTQRTGFPILSRPWKRHGTTPISRAHFHFTFGNDLTRAESDRIWQEQAVPSYNTLFFEGVAAAVTGRGVTAVDVARADRAPLLVITGEQDHVVPPAIGRAIVKKYRNTGSPAVVAYQEFAGRTHRIVSQDGWEEVADHALTWATTHAAAHLARTTDPVQQRTPDLTTAATV